jgi:predicted RNase H-like nuclease (RuvC/YqgF family)
VDCFETAQKRLHTFQGSYKALQYEEKSVGELKQTIEHQEQSILQQDLRLNTFKKQLQEKDARIEMLESESVKLKQAAEKEKTAREAEAKQRDKAESRFSEYLEEQQQMAARYLATEK